MERHPPLSYIGGGKVSMSNVTITYELTEAVFKNLTPTQAMILFQRLEVGRKMAEGAMCKVFNIESRSSDGSSTVIVSYERQSCSLKQAIEYWPNAYWSEEYVVFQLKRLVEALGNLQRNRYRYIDISPATLFFCKDDELKLGSFENIVEENLVGLDTTIGDDVYKFGLSMISLLLCRNLPPTNTEDIFNYKAEIEARGYSSNLSSLLTLLVSPTKRETLRFTTLQDNICASEGLPEIDLGSIMPEIASTQPLNISREVGNFSYVEDHPVRIEGSLMVYASQGGTTESLVEHNNIQPGTGPFIFPYDDDHPEEVKKQLDALNRSTPNTDTISSKEPR